MSNPRDQYFGHLSRLGPLYKTMDYFHNNEYAVKFADQPIEQLYKCSYRAFSKFLANVLS